MGEWGGVSGETIAMGCGGRDEAGVGVRGGMAFGATGDEGCCCCPPPLPPLAPCSAPGPHKREGSAPAPSPQLLAVISRRGCNPISAGPAALGGPRRNPRQSRAPHRRELLGPAQVRPPRAASGGGGPLPPVPGGGAGCRALLPPFLLLLLLLPLAACARPSSSSSSSSPCPLAAGGSGCPAGDTPRLPPLRPPLPLP